MAGKPVEYLRLVIGHHRELHIVSIGRRIGRRRLAAFEPAGRLGRGHASCFRACELIRDPSGGEAGRRMQGDDMGRIEEANLDDRGN